MSTRPMGPSRAMPGREKNSSIRGRNTTARLRVVDHVRGQAANPYVLFDVLQSGAPAWVGGGNFWSQDNADFVAAFILGASGSRP